VAEKRNQWSKSLAKKAIRIDGEAVAVAVNGRKWAIMVGLPSRLIPAIICELLSVSHSYWAWVGLLLDRNMTAIVEPISFRSA